MVYECSTKEFLGASQRWYWYVESALSSASFYVAFVAEDALVAVTCSSDVDSSCFCIRIEAMLLK